MWIVWFLSVLAGGCLVLSLMERPPKAVSVVLFRSKSECAAAPSDLAGRD